MTQRLAADVGLGHLLDVQRRLHARFNAVVAAAVLQRHRVHHGGEHAHVVARGAVHAGRAERNAAEDVAAAHDDADFNAEVDDALDFLNHALQNAAIDAEGVFAHQGFAGKFEKNSLVDGLQSFFFLLIHFLLPQ